MIVDTTSAIVCTMTHNQLTCGWQYWLWTIWLSVAYGDVKFLMPTHTDDRYNNTKRVDEGEYTTTYTKYCSYVVHNINMCNLSVGCGWLASEYQIAEVWKGCKIFVVIQGGFSVNVMTSPISKYTAGSEYHKIIAFLKGAHARLDLICQWCSVYHHMLTTT